MGTTTSVAAKLDRVDGEVKALLSHYFQAVEAHDLTGYLELFSPDEHLTIFENTEMYDWNRFRPYVENFMREVAEIRLELEQCAVNSLAPDVAIATGIFNGAGRLASGESLAFRNCFTFVVVERDRAWRIKHIHESSLA